MEFWASILSSNQAWSTLKLAASARLKDYANMDYAYTDYAYLDYNYIQQPSNAAHPLERDA